MTSEPGSFARATIIERKPQIIEQVILDNHYPPVIVRALDEFRNEIATQPIQPLRETASDIADWNDALTAYAGKTWLEVPWYFAETFFYRKLLEAIQYFQTGEKQNPYQALKDRLIAGDIQRLSAEWDQFAALDVVSLFEALLHSCLWGNRADLSNFTVKVKARGGLSAREERHLILIDHTDPIRAILSKGVQRVDFINDNVGSDLLFDLAFSDFLLRQGWVSHIHLHLKNYPFFVSDAMLEDVLQTVTLLKSSSSEAMSAMGVRLEEALDAQRLHLNTDPFWTSWKMFRQMPPHLREQISHADLVFIKGDVNYRRLLDDLHWPYTTRLEDVVGYLPAPFVALRTLKGEIMVGLQPGEAETLQAEDPTWLINGKRGVIQLVMHGGSGGHPH